MLNSNFFDYEDIDCKIQNALKLNSWILLGSLTETVLQMFLAFYIDDYRKTKWQQWEEFEKEKVQTPIFECIQRLVDENNLDAMPVLNKNNKVINNTVFENEKLFPRFFQVFFA